MPADHDFAIWFAAERKDRRTYQELYSLAVLKLRLIALPWLLPVPKCAPGESRGDISIAAIRALTQRGT